MLNNAQVIGYLGKDPEVRYTQSGDAIANLILATSEKWTDKQTGEKKEATEWHKIVFYGKPAETLQNYTQKGTLLYVSGKIETRKWTDKEGIERYTTQINGRDFKILREGKSAAQQGAGAKHGNTSSNAPDDFDQDIPF
jgi:single-strand DNA-binding protein